MEVNELYGKQKIKIIVFVLCLPLLFSCNETGSQKKTNQPTEIKKNGCFAGDCVNGQGTLKLTNGDKYEGSFVAGKYEGQGKLNLANGETYQGGFVAGKKEGQGTYIFANGTKYDGGFKNDDIEGQGTYIFANGDEYEGGFVAGKYEGKGTITYANGTKKEGQWKANNYLGNEQEHLINEAKAEALRQEVAANEARAIAYRQQAEAEKAKAELEEVNSNEYRQAQRRKNNLEIVGKLLGGMTDLHQKGNECRSKCEIYSNEIDEEGGFLSSDTSPRQRCKNAC
jgi:hypothetical protein